MGRNDDLFSIPNSLLNEKTKSTERLIQALDEMGVSGDFRKLLERHFASSWSKELGNVEKIEKALTEVQKIAELPDKVSAFVNVIFRSDQYRGFEWDTLLEEGDAQIQVQNRYSSCFNFAKEVATQVFPKSPYGFYQCFRGCFLYNFEKFILSYAQFFYGESSSPLLLLINDKRLFEENRLERLLAVFNTMIGGPLSFIEYLKEVFDARLYGNGELQKTRKFERAFKFLREWVKSDAQFGQYSESKNLPELIFRKSGLLELDEHIDFWQISGERELFSEDELREFKEWVYEFVRQKKQELEKEWCLNVCHSGLSDDEFDEWAKLSYVNRLPLCQDLSEEQATSLIAWGNAKDLEKMKLPNNRVYFLDSENGSLFSTDWYISPFKEIWRKHLTSSIKNLPCEERLQVVGPALRSINRDYPNLLPQYISLPQRYFQEEHNYEDEEWWNSLLKSLPDDETFPKMLYPFWTIKMWRRLGYNEDLVAHADKSLGIIRGGIYNGEESFNTEDVVEFIKILMRFSPEKAVRHIFLLLRNSQQPFSTENLDIDRQSLYPKSMSEILDEFSAAYFNSRPSLNKDGAKDPINGNLELFSSIRIWAAKYCLSRLRLRKGEKVVQGHYNPEQVVEKSDVWRKAYLKVLEELGLDLQGKVHKTIFFIRKFDPAEDVRELAKTCYKAVRREHNKSADEDDIRRGLIAAYWWLLLAQRQSLQLKINHEEAIKTRRRLLRRS